jgi:hypothetical protein
MSLVHKLTFGGGGPGLRPSALRASSSVRLVELELILLVTWKVACSTSTLDPTSSFPTMCGLRKAGSAMPVMPDPTSLKVSVSSRPVIAAHVG